MFFGCWGVFFREDKKLNFVFGCFFSLPFFVACPCGVRDMVAMELEATLELP